MKFLAQRWVDGQPGKNPEVLRWFLFQFTTVFVKEVASTKVQWSNLRKKGSSVG